MIYDFPPMVIQDVPPWLSTYISHCGKENRESAPFTAPFAVCLDIATMCINDSPGYCKAQPGASLFARPCRIYPIKAIKNMGDVVWIDTNSRIFYLESQPPPISSQAQQNFSSRRCKPDRIVQQVLKALNQSLTIPTNQRDIPRLEVGF